MPQRFSELAGVATPSALGGVPQMPIEGTSMAYCFSAPEVSSQRTTQYYEMLGHRDLP
ncbi:MAG: hypothetical protein R2706_14545 [Acidimicrobiales bacterium]